jgi:caffeoyl-CoA O-methyltransferase
MELIAPEVGKHITALVPARHPEMQAMEQHARETGFPIIGPAAGHFCYLLARITNAQRIFELGSGYGYSTAWFALAVRENGGGTVHHVVWDEELSDRACRSMTRMGLRSCVQFEVSEAVAALRAADGPFDIIFNDIDKQAYPDSLDVIEMKLRPGGLLIVDNALWSGRIFDKDEHSPQTEGIRELTRRLTSSPAWITSLVPIRDGLLVAQYRSESARERGNAR